MDSAGAGGADLQHAVVTLRVEGQDVAAKICGDAVFDEQPPERIAIFVADGPLIRPDIAVHRKGRMMANDEPPAGVTPVGQRFGQPFRLHMAFAAQALVERVHHDKERIAAPERICEAILSRRAVRRMVRHDVVKDACAHIVIDGVVRRRVENRDGRPIKPGHLRIEPMAPLGAERGFVSDQANDLVAWIDDEFGRRGQAAHDVVDAAMRLAVRRFRYAGATVAVEDELQTGAVRL